MRRRSLVYVAAWAAATSFGVAISWAGVRGVLYTAALPPPPAVSAPSSSTGSPGSGPSTTSAPSPPAMPSARPTRTAPGTRTTTRTPLPSDGKVRSFTLRGGHVALAFDQHRIRLISATPNTGWETSVWDDGKSGWLRVDFRRDGHSSSIFGMWSDGTPRVRFSGT